VRAAFTAKKKPSPENVKDVFDLSQGRGAPRSTAGAISENLLVGYATTQSALANIRQLV